MANRLIKEKSPYLLQHAHNPVDWFPWGEEAFNNAKKEDKPIFLSIGYSTCHWCHVMEKESFEDLAVAKLMNNAFVSIKVDREERPDVDKTYMDACQMMTGSGGWPLSIIMTPDKKPFFCATYIPKSSNYNLLGMIQLIPQIKKIWKEDRKKALVISEEIVKNLKREKNKSQNQIDNSVLDKAYLSLAANFDDENGGFGHSPKFPSPLNMLFLLRHWKKTKDKKALHMVEKTLLKMGLGGIFDHIGFGFHRYSTDERWLVPHFEKMLYDQALIAIAYTEAFQATKKEFYKTVAQKIFAYAMRDMTSQRGVFYTAEDADSEGVEGKFYLWAEDEIRKNLSKKEADLFIKLYNVKKQGNTHESDFWQMNILHLDVPINKDGEKEVDAIRDKLFMLRDKRIKPQKDHKILTDWNGLMIASLAIASRVFDSKKYLKAAENSVSFFLGNLKKNNGKLLHTYYEDGPKIKPKLDDYAFFVWALLEMYETTFENRYLEHAVKLNEEMIRYFYDKKEGGLFFSTDDEEKVIVRHKDAADNVVPSGNSVALANLIRLSVITGKEKLKKIAIESIKMFSEDILKYPAEYIYFLTVFSSLIDDFYEITIAAKNKDDALQINKLLQDMFVPGKIVIFNDKNKLLEDNIRGKKLIKGKFTVYICDNTSCKEPITDIAELKKALSLDLQK